MSSLAGGCEPLASTPDVKSVMAVPADNTTRATARSSLWRKPHSEHLLSQLASLNGPRDLRKLDDEQLQELCADIRGTIIGTVAKTGGHLGSSLGVVELTVALHRLLDSPSDKIVWDTGHQAYAHKLLTGRLADFGTLRQLGGVGGFPRRSESPHDMFDGGHAGTGLSIAEGLALAREQRGTQGEDRGRGG